MLKSFVIGERCYGEPVEMRIAHVMVCHSADPTKAFQSIPETPGDPWYIFMHGESDEIALIAEREAIARSGRYFDYRLNRGLARTWNDALRLAEEDECEITMLLNDDLFFYQDGYKMFRETLASLRELSVNVCYATLLGLESGNSPYEGQTMQQGFACCAIMREAVERVGYFDENYYPAYHEDLDYYLRCVKSGMTIHVDSRILVEHERSTTLRVISVAQQLSMEQSRSRNEDYFYEKWKGREDGLFVDAPFDNPSFDLKISFEKRRRPYLIGPEHENLEDLPSSVGYIDDFHKDQIAGWVGNVNRSSESFFVQVWEGERLLSLTEANLQRDDLSAIGFIECNHGFHIALPFSKVGSLRDLRILAVTAERPLSQLYLQHTPQSNKYLQRELARERRRALLLRFLNAINIKRLQRKRYKN